MVHVVVVVVVESMCGSGNDNKGTIGVVGGVVEEEEIED